MPRPKGLPKTGGRQKGTQNRQTQLVKEAVMLCYEGIGGLPALMAWARKNPTEFYARVMPRLIPHEMQHTGPDGGPVQIREMRDYFVEAPVTDTAHARTH